MGESSLAMLLLLLSDVVSDLVFSHYLLSLHQVWGGGILLASILVPLLLLPLYSGLSSYTRIKQRVTVSDLLVVSPFIHSAPAAIVQLMVVWAGLVEDEGWRWCQYISLILSLATLVLLARFNLRSNTRN